MPRKIILTSGHSNADPGAISFDKRYREADLALRLRNLTTEALRTLGAEVINDGDHHVNKPLIDAIKLCRANPQAIKVEIHFNAGPPTASGVEALSHPQYRPIAEAICAAVALHSKTHVRGDRGWKAANSGQHKRLGFCEAGGVILEVEFISNATALGRYLSSEKEIAQALAKALFSLSEPMTP